MLKSEPPRMGKSISEMSLGPTVFQKVLGLVLKHKRKVVSQPHVSLPSWIIYPLNGYMIFIYPLNGYMI